MGLIRVIIIFIANITIFVLTLRLVSMVLERLGVFRFMNSLVNKIFGRKDDGFDD